MCCHLTVCFFELQSVLIAIMNINRFEHLWSPWFLFKIMCNLGLKHKYKNILKTVYIYIYWENISCAVKHIFGKQTEVLNVGLLLSFEGGIQKYTVVKIPQCSCDSLEICCEKPVCVTDSINYYQFTNLTIN